MSYYRPDSVTAVTMTDASKQMLWHAKQKHSQQNAKLPIRFCLADAQAMLSARDANDPSFARQNSDAPPAVAAQSHQSSHDYSSQPQSFAPKQFDTVVDTFGLCSHRDPVAALKVSSHGRCILQHACIPSHLAI